MPPLRPFRSSPAVRRVREHYGPGPHTGTGTPQTVHAGGRTGRRAKAWAEMFKVGAATWEGKATDDAIRKRKSYGPGGTARPAAPGLADLADHDLRAAARSGMEPGGQAAAEAEMRRRGWDRTTLQPRGFNLGALARLKGSSVKRATAIRARALAEAEAWVRRAEGYARAGRQALLGVDPRDLRGALGHLARNETRGDWWVKHEGTPGDQLLELAFARERLGYKRETQNVRRWGGMG